MATARQALRQRREQLDMSQEGAALAVGVSTTTYRAWEAGTATPRVGRRRRLAEVLEWPAVQVSVALNGVGAPNGHAVPSWLGHLASLEQGASEIWAYEPVVIHGLLQTAAYATAVESIGPSRTTAEEIVRRVESRIARQGVLTRAPDPLRLAVVLDESVLRRVAGSPSVMVGQLNHLADMAVRPNIDLQVLPLAAGVFSAAFGAFLVLASSDSANPYMAVTEDRAGPHYLDRVGDIEAHTDLFRYLSSNALSPSESVDLITVTAKETPS